MTVRGNIFRVIHPFHPLFGREFELVDYRKNWGEDRVYFYDAEGQLQAILASCTDAGGSDPFVAIAAVRARPPTTRKGVK